MSLVHVCSRISFLLSLGKFRHNIHDIFHCIFLGTHFLFDLFVRCQPWTITLTGVSVIAGSWLVLHNVLATSAAVTLIGTWWYIFLYSYPKVWANNLIRGYNPIISIEQPQLLYKAMLFMKIILFQAYTDMIAERRKKVTSGDEDTFGIRSSP